MFPSVVGGRGFEPVDAWPTDQAGNDRPSGHVTWTRSGRSRALDFVSAGYEQEGGVGKGRHVRGYALASSFAMRFDWTDAKPSLPVRSDLDHARLTLIGWSRPSIRKGHARRRSDLHAVSVGHCPLLRRRTRSFSGPLHGNSLQASWWGCDVHASSKRRSRKGVFVSALILADISSSHRRGRRTFLFGRCGVHPLGYGWSIRSERSSRGGSRGEKGSLERRIGMGSVPCRFSGKKTNLFHSASRISFGWIPLRHMSRGDGTDRVARRDDCPSEPGSTCGIPSHVSASRIDGRAYVRFHASRLHRRRDGMADPPYSMFQRPFRRILPFLAWSPRCISIVLRAMWMVSSPSHGPFFAISHRGNDPPDLPPFPVRTLRRTPYDPVPLFDLLSASRISSWFATFPLRACL